MTTDEKAREIVDRPHWDMYQDEIIEDVAAALAAARREAIEEAAKVAEARNLSIMSMTTADITAIEIAASIRALKDKQP